MKQLKVTWFPVPIICGLETHHSKTDAIPQSGVHAKTSSLRAQFVKRLWSQQNTTYTPIELSWAMALTISWDRFINFEVKTPSESSWKEMVPPSYEEAVGNNSGIGNSQPSTNASVNSSSAHPPPRATAGHLLTLSVPGVGHPQFYRGPGAGHLPTPGRPPGIRHTCFGKRHGWVHRERRGVCRTMFSQF